MVPLVGAIKIVGEAIERGSFASPGGRLFSECFSCTDFWPKTIGEFWLNRHESKEMISIIFKEEIEFTVVLENLFSSLLLIEGDYGWKPEMCLLTVLLPIWQCSKSPAMAFRRWLHPCYLLRRRPNFGHWPESEGSLSCWPLPSGLGLSKSCTYSKKKMWSNQVLYSFIFCF